MPIKQSAIKALRQNKKRAEKNARERARLYDLLRKSRRAGMEKVGDVALQMKETVQALDKAVAHRLLKQKTAARLKSRLMRQRHRK